MHRYLLLVSVLAALGGAGCAGSNDEDATFACDRGFRSSDWKTEALKTGQSIVKCGWVNGWSEQSVRRELGRPYGGSARNGIHYNLGASQEGIGPLLWILTIELDFDSRRVIDASTETKPF
jgi:hypothetical protein